AVDATIHPRDEMLLHDLKDHDWDFALTSYFLRGLETASVHSQLLAHFLDGRRDIDLLDFAAGFGRVTRFFAAHHTPQRIVASDIQAEAVEFQLRQFGVHAVLSSNNPADFKLHRNVQCVVALSFFSHVSPSRFEQWLAALAKPLDANGILVFSVHDESLLDADRRDRSAITFEHTSESDRLDSSEYGTTWVSEQYVREAVARSCPERSVVRLPRGLGSFQDLYVIHDGKRTGMFDFDQGPFGFASIARLFGDEFHLVGWASHQNPARRVREVVIELQRDVVARVESFFPRRDVVEHLGDDRHLRSGWHARFRVPETASHLTGILIVKAVSDLGVATILYAGTIAGLLLASCRAVSKQDDREEFERRIAELNV
ncbi:MAG TPA: class I SAM-dependent methyltransferase, partial [Thermoanaerobaculia bacterium]